MSLDYDKLGSAFSGLEAFGQNPEALELVRNTINLRIGKQVAFKGSINGQKVNAFATLKSANLSRLTLLRQTRKQPSTSPNQDYYIVTGAFTNVDMEILVEDSGKLIPLHDVWRQMTNAAAKTNHSSEQFLAHLTRIGMNYTNGTFPVYFQQMGADPAKIEATFNMFRDLGGYDDVASMQKATRDASRPQRMERALKIDSPIPVTFFEVSSVDRDKIEVNKHIKDENRKQGFINFCDSLTNQFSRVTGQRHAAVILQQELDRNDKLNDKQIKDINAQITKLRAMSSQYSQVWSGSQQVSRTNETTKQVEFVEQFAPTNAPCGRFDLLVDGQTINVDLWKNSVRDADSNTATAKVAPLKTLSADDDPLS